MTDFRMERSTGNPYVACNVAEDLDLSTEIWDTFSDVFKNYSDIHDHIEIYRDGTISTGARNQLISELSNLLDVETEQGASFIREYLLLLTERLPDIGTEYVDPLSLHEKAQYIINEGQEDNQDLKKFYKLNWKYEKFYSERGRLSLLPFFDLIYQTIRPLSARGELPHTLEKILTDDDPLPIENVREMLFDLGLFVEKEFLEFFFLNSNNFILLDWNGGSVDLADEIFPSFDLAAYGLVPETYIKSFGLSYRDGISPVGFDVNVNAQPLREFFQNRDEARFIEYVNWEEIAVKLKMTRKEDGGKIQGMPISVHKEIVKCLNKRQKALRVPDLKKEIGIDSIHLDAEDLPPGQIMAYAPGPRFMDRDSMRYVLKDWTQDEKNWKNRISSTRVLSPDRHKDTYFETNRLEEKLQQNSAYLQFGLISSGDLAYEMAHSLAEKPTDIYHLNLIRQQVEAFLALTYFGIGKGLYVDNRFLSLLNTYKGKTRQRREIAKSILHGPDPLRLQLDMLDNDVQGVIAQLI